MMNSLVPVADAEAVDQRGRLLIAGYAVKRISASLSPRDRRESGRAVPRGAHRARSALSASTRESTVAGRAARETLGVLGRNGEAPSDRSLGASVYRPSPLVGDEREMAPHSSRLRQLGTESTEAVTNRRAGANISDLRGLRQTPSRAAPDGAPRATCGPEPLAAGLAPVQPGRPDTGRRGRDVGIPEIGVFHNVRNTPICGTPPSAHAGLGPLTWSPCALPW